MNPVLEARMQRRERQETLNAPAVATRLIIEGDTLRSIRTQDCTPIAERAYSMHKEGMHGSKEMKLAASIPMVIIEKYCNENGVQFHEFMSDEVHMRRICNNPDNKMFRVWPGNL